MRGRNGHQNDPPMRKDPELAVSVRLHCSQRESGLWGQVMTPQPFRKTVQRGL